MILSGGMIFRSVRFIWAAALVVAMAGVTDGWAAPKAKITVQPVKQTAELGGSASLMVTTTSPSPITYQWRFNKVAIPGANSASCLINPVTADSAGKYDVVLTNAGGTVTSKQVVLTVDLAPPSLPIGTALYDEVTIFALGKKSTETGSWMVSGPSTLVDPEYSSDYTTYIYTRLAVNRAKLTVTSLHFESGYGVFNEWYEYTLVFTGVSPTGELETKSSGRAILTSPSGYRPAKIGATFSGATSIEFPP